MPYKVLIVEDEKLTANRLAKMLEDVKEEYEVVGIAGGVAQTIEWLNNNPTPDLGLFDIQLSDGLSFEIFHAVNITFPVIFITAYDDHALKALKLNATDYLLKPVKQTELFQALTKFKQQKNVLDEQSLIKLIKTFLPENVGKTDYLERIKLNIGNRLKVVNVEDIAYFFIQNKGVYAISHDNDKYLLSMNLDEIESSVNPKQFFRINRQFIVSIKALGKMTMYSKSRIKLDLNPDPGVETITSVERSADFKDWLGG
jgi:DNA-binding LytR/AlgR family response regulator